MWFNILLIAILIICVITDLNSRKIYNKVIYPSLLITFASHLVTGGWEGFYHSFIGCLIGFGLLLIPYFLGGMGAGDVKLLALIGALKGGTFVFETFIYMALLGAIMALFILIFKTGIPQRLKGTFLAIFRARNVVKQPINIKKEALTATYPYGVAIAGGAFVNLLIGGGLIL